MKRPQPCPGRTRGRSWESHDNCQSRYQLHSDSKSVAWGHLSSKRQRIYARKRIQGNISNSTLQRRKERPSHCTHLTMLELSASKVSPVPSKQMTTVRWLRFPWYMFASVRAEITEGIAKWKVSIVALLVTGIISTQRKEGRGGEGRSFFDVSSNKSNSKACFTPIEIFDCIQSETANSGQVCAPFSPTQMEPSNAFMHHRRRRVRTDKKSSK